MNDRKKAAFRLGVIVFVALLVLTVIEWYVSLALEGMVLLFILALIKAALIVTYFMHIARLWREESH